LTLAEHFVGVGNLDGVAESLRTNARLYITGASFWDQDWVQAQSFFAQVMIGYPNLSDSSCMSATNRWVEATVHVAEQILASGDSCGAEAQYASVFTVNDPINATVNPTATEVANQCNGGVETGTGETPTVTGTPVETPTRMHPGIPSGTPTATFTGTPTGNPTATPTFTPTGISTDTPNPTCDPSGTPCP
jgi:hypothetical protein